MGDGHFGIGQLVGLSVVKAVAPFVGVVVPGNLNLRFVDGSLEWFHGSSLGHTCHRADIGIGLFVVDDEQVAVALQVGRVTVLAGTVSVAGVAVQTAGAHIHGTQSLEGSRSVGVEVILKEILSFVKGSHHARILYGQGGLFESRRRVVGGSAQFSSGKIVFGIVDGRSFANLP